MMVKIANETCRETIKNMQFYWNENPNACLLASKTQRNERHQINQSLSSMNRREDMKFSVYR